MMSKVANDNGSRRIMYLSQGMEAGLKILVSAVQSRPCPPLFSASCPSPIFRRREFVTRFLTNSGTLQGTPAHFTDPGRPIDRSPRQNSIRGRAGRGQAGARTAPKAAG